MHTLNALAPHLPLAAFIAGTEAMRLGARLDTCHCGNRLWLYDLTADADGMRRAGWRVNPADDLGAPPYGAVPALWMKVSMNEYRSLREHAVAQIDLEEGCSCLPF